MTLALAALILLSISLAACQYAAQSGNPVARNFTWFDYLGAENLKAACGQGVSDRLRFINKPIFDTQIQSYDVPGLPGGWGVSVSSWERGVGDLTKGIAITDLLFSWRGTRVKAVLYPQSFANFISAFRKDRFTGFKRIGLLPPSNEFKRVVAGCAGGRFHANAWLYPTDRYKLLKFQGVSLEQDKTGVELKGAVTIERCEEDPTFLERPESIRRHILVAARVEWHCRCAGIDLNDR